MAELKVTLDMAVDRAADLGKQIRRLETEREKLKDHIRSEMRGRGVEHHETPGGHDALLYSRTTTAWDLAYLRTVLTPEQLEKAMVVSTNPACLKVT